MHNRERQLPWTVICPVTRVLVWALVIGATSVGVHAEEAVRIVLVGDSTVADKSGWGKGFKLYAAEDVTCINTARGGRSSKSFIDEGHWEKALALKGDYYLIQFGHNGQPGKGPERETDPATTYPELMGRYVDDVRAIGGEPVLVTSLVRRRFTEGTGPVESTLAPWAEAVLKLGREKQVPVVDLHASSRRLCIELGPEGCVPFSPLDKEGGVDPTHLNDKGSLLFSRLVVEGLRQVAPSLAGYLREPSLEVIGKFLGADAAPVEAPVMQSIYEEARTPHKYGIVIDPPEGKKVDCPNVFRHGDKWYMVYVQVENDPQGYTTQLAESEDLLRWKPLGTVLPRGAAGTWDAANAGGGLALCDLTWGNHTLQTYGGRYWMSYIGGPNAGYEKLPLSIGLASTGDPTKPEAWAKRSEPILRHDDPDARAFESDVLYKSFIFRDPDMTLGVPYVMFYNARPPKGDEVIGAALSHDMERWTRHGEGALLVNDRPPNLTHGVITGDPQIFRMKGVWVMFYFGAFWKEGAFDTFAASRDLVHWTKWEGDDLIRPSEPWDTPFAHKPWLIKHNGVVYHFYCSVGGKEHHRAIAVATSKPLGAALNHR